MLVPGEQCAVSSGVLWEGGPGRVVRETERIPNSRRGSEETDIPDQLLLLLLLLAIAHAAAQR